MSVGRVFFKKKPKNVVQGKSVDVGVRRIINKTTTPVIAGDSFEMDAVGALRLSPLRRGLTIDSTVDIFTFYVPQRHVYGEQWIKFMKDGFKAEDGMPDLIVTCVQTCAFLISSRRRHTRSDRDWSSDVCSSDLPLTREAPSGAGRLTYITRCRHGPVSRPCADTPRSSSARGHGGCDDRTPDRGDNGQHEDAQASRIPSEPRSGPLGIPTRWSLFWPGQMFDVGDAMNLPYVDGSLDACRAETLLQHLTDPQQAVHEMTRVTRPGGRAAIPEFDTGTVLAGHPDRETTQVIPQRPADDAVQAWIGRQ